MVEIMMELDRGSSSLRPRARIMRTLGDELISNNVVAIIELVKNAYDADATRVLIQFSQTNNGTECIEIIDNGHGMSLETVKNVWMEPATLFKRHYTRSEFGSRPVLGNKGIGRFAASRLADNLELVTRRTRTSTEVVAFLDWTKFDDETKYLDEIKVDWLEREPVEIKNGGYIETLWKRSTGDLPMSTIDLEHGTILRLENLKSRWTSELIQELRIGLARLVSPPVGDKEKPPQREFIIRLRERNNLDETADDRILPNHLLKNPPYTLQGLVNADGSINLQISLRDENRIVYVNDLYKPKDGEYTNCGPFGIMLEVWDLDKASLSHLLKNGITLKDVRSTLNIAAGISIYRDGFRVMPYGEPFNDWLRLDNRSRQNPTLRLANNQIIGFVAISAEGNPELKDQSNREGIVEGPAMDDLRNILKVALSHIESERYKTRRPKGKENKGKGNNQHEEGGIFEGLDFGNILEFAQKKHPEDIELIKALEEKENVLKLRLKRFKEVLSRYRRLSSLGQLIDGVLHEGRTPIGIIKNEAILGKLDITGLGTPDCREALNRFIVIEEQTSLLSDLFIRIEPFSGRRSGNPAVCELELLIRQSANVLQWKLRENKVKISIPSTSTKLLVVKSEIQEILVNLLDNSLHWLTEKPESEREIVVEVGRLGENSLEIIVSDSGKGVPLEDRDFIFDPYFSKKPNGVGLGLTIVGEIVNDYYGGRLELLDDGPLSGATFRIILNGRD